MLNLCQQKAAGLIRGRAIRTIGKSSPSSQIIGTTDGQGGKIKPENSQIKKAEEIIHRYCDEWVKIRGVIGVGIGIGNEAYIKIRVLPKEIKKVKEIIPSKIEGINVFLVESEIPKAL